MTIQEILSLENHDGPAIHLVKDRLFWQAYEMSAYLFTHYFKQYKARYQYYKCVSRGLVQIGFPATKLDSFIQSAKDKGLQVIIDGDSHVVISGMPQVGGYDGWKLSAEQNADTKSTKEQTNIQAETLLFRRSYEFSLYIIKLCSRMSKKYKYCIGDELIRLSSGLTDHIHAYLNHISPMDWSYALNAINTIRVRIRMMNDLQEINTRQWLFANQSIQEILNIAIPESRRHHHADGSVNDGVQPYARKITEITPDCGFLVSPQPT